MHSFRLMLGHMLAWLNRLKQRMFNIQAQCLDFINVTFTLGKGIKVFLVFYVIALFANWPLTDGLTTECYAHLKNF